MYIFRVNCNQTNNVYCQHRVHSASAVCPHNRVLPNMVSTCITAIYSASEELPANCSEAEFECYYTNHLRCYIVVLKNM